MIDRILISGFTVNAIIGIHAPERITPQDIRFDIELATDARRAAQTDDIGAALNYADVCTIVRDTAQRGAFQLVETLAERVAERLREEMGVQWLKLRVSKPLAIADAELVGVEIERGTVSARVDLSHRETPPGKA